MFFLFLAPNGALKDAPIEHPFFLQIFKSSHTALHQSLRITSIVCTNAKKHAFDLSWTRTYLYSLSNFFRLSSFALQMSTSDSVRYIHSLWRHISSTAGKLLGNDDRLLLMSFVPRRLTVVINKMSLKRKRHRSFLIHGEELVVTRSCRRRTRLDAARSLWPKPWINTSSCLNIKIVRSTLSQILEDLSICCLPSCSSLSLSTLLILKARSWISRSARCSSAKSGWSASVCFTSRWKQKFYSDFEHFLRESVSIDWGVDAYSTN